MRPDSRACLDAVRLAQDSTRLRNAPAGELVVAAATLAQVIVKVLDSGAGERHRLAAFTLVDAAGKTIGAELRRRAR